MINFLIMANSFFMLSGLPESVRDPNESGFILPVARFLFSMALHHFVS